MLVCTALRLHTTTDIVHRRHVAGVYSSTATHHYRHCTLETRCWCVQHYGYTPLPTLYTGDMLPACTALQLHTTTDIVHRRHVSGVCSTTATHHYRHCTQETRCRRVQLYGYTPLPTLYTGDTLPVCAALRLHTTTDIVHRRHVAGVYSSTATHHYRHCTLETRCWCVQHYGYTPLPTLYTGDMLPACIALQLHTTTDIVHRRHVAGVYSYTPLPTLYTGDTLPVCAALRLHTTTDIVHRRHVAGVYSYTPLPTLYTGDTLPVCAALRLHTTTDIVHRRHVAGVYSYTPLPTLYTGDTLPVCAALRLHTTTDIVHRRHVAGVYSSTATHHYRHCTMETRCWCVQHYGCTPLPTLYSGDTLPACKIYAYTPLPTLYTGDALPVCTALRLHTTTDIVHRRHVAGVYSSTPTHHYRHCTQETRCRRVQLYRHCL